MIFRIIPSMGVFWRKNPQLRRKNCSGYFATCLDYAAQEVRDYFKALVTESLERYDIDGLELDFMREPSLFSAGKEAEGAPILTGWMREVRKLTTDAATRRGHPVHLGVRVPSRPEVASAMGLDALTWAKEGLIDLLVVTPRWATVEFDMPIPRWRQMLGASKVTLAGGLEVRYQSCPGGPASIVTPELAAGAAVSVLSRGAGRGLSFQLLPIRSSATARLSEYVEGHGFAGLLAEAAPMRRNHVSRHHGAGREVPSAAAGDRQGSRVSCAPRTRPGQSLALRASDRVRSLARHCRAVPTALVNGNPCEVRSDVRKDGLRLVSFSVPATALAGTESHQITLASKDQNALTIQRVEMSLREPGGASGKTP